MKNLVTKLFAVIFIIMLAAGCASSIVAPQAELETNQETTEIEAPDTGDVTGDSRMTQNVGKW